MKPNKLLGQNWLINPKIHEALVAAGEVTAKDFVLEIGPGTGLLTEPLAKTGATILAIEKDHNLISRLQNRFAAQKNVRILTGDILKFDSAGQELKRGEYKVIGNIPYYLTSRLFRVIFEEWPRPSLLVFLIQKEVAQRLVAKPPQMSLLALSIQFYSEAKIIKEVSRRNFSPIPKVDSAIIQLSPRILSAEEQALAPVLFKLARMAFHQKRKQLISSLAAGLEKGKTEVENFLRQADLDPHLRPQALTIPQWLKLSSQFSSHFSADSS